jgi:tetrapyrrole methylase family protein/MazG family protein
MVCSGIVILGLGPGDPNLLTREAWELIKNASDIYLRTSKHPTVDGFPSQVVVHSFDNLYDECSSYESVYKSIVDEIITLGKRPEGVIYAVPGHPFIAESTGPEIFHRARHENIPVRICDGISFIEPVFSSLGLDPLPFTSLVDALTLLEQHHPPFPPDSPALIAQIYDSHIAAEVKLTLMNLYPDKHPVKLVHSAGTGNVIIEDICLYEIDRSPHIGLLTVLYLPPLNEQTSFESLQGIAAHLRAPEGCPWDQEQTCQTMRPHLLEEAYELLAAIDKGEPSKIKEELGDLLLVITMMMRISSEEGDFTSADVVQKIIKKLINRHPHVFKDLTVDGTDAVLKNWEAIKSKEREANGGGDRLLMDGVSGALPALLQAQEFQDRAARVGFDWTSIKGVIDKVKEEIAEIQAAADMEERAAELGDLLFTLVNLSRWYKVDAESALRGANFRFKERFTYIERSCRDKALEISEMTMEELNSLWEVAKGL